MKNKFLKCRNFPQPERYVYGAEMPALDVVSSALHADILKAIVEVDALKEICRKIEGLGTGLDNFKRTLFDKAAPILDDKLSAIAREGRRITPETLQAEARAALTKVIESAVPEFEALVAKQTASALKAAAGVVETVEKAAGSLTVDGKVYAIGSEIQGFSFKGRPAYLRLHPERGYCLSANATGGHGKIIRLGNNPQTAAVELKTLFSRVSAATEGLAVGADSLTVGGKVYRVGELVPGVSFRGRPAFLMGSKETGFSLSNYATVREFETVIPLMGNPAEALQGILQEEVRAKAAAVARAEAVATEAARVAAETERAAPAVKALREAAASAIEAEEARVAGYIKDLPIGPGRQPLLEEIMRRVEAVSLYDEVRVAADSRDIGRITALIQRIKDVVREATDAAVRTSFSKLGMPLPKALVPPVPPVGPLAGAAAEAAPTVAVPAPVAPAGSAPAAQVPLAGPAPAPVAAASVAAEALQEAEMIAKVKDFIARARPQFGWTPEEAAQATKAVTDALRAAPQGTTKEAGNAATRAMEGAARDFTSRAVAARRAAEAARLAEKARRAVPDLTSMSADEAAELAERRASLDKIAATQRAARLAKAKAAPASAVGEAAGAAARVAETAPRVAEAAPRVFKTAADVMSAVGKGEEVLLSAEELRALGFTFTKGAKASMSVARFGPYVAKAIPIVNAAISVAEAGIQGYKLYKENNDQGGMEGITSQVERVAASQRAAVQKEAADVIAQQDMRAKLGGARNFARGLLNLVQDYGVSRRGVDTKVVGSGQAGSYSEGYVIDPIAHAENLVGSAFGVLPLVGGYGSADANARKAERGTITAMVKQAEDILAALRQVEPKSGTVEVAEKASTILGLEQAIQTARQTLSSDAPPAKKAVSIVKQKIEEGAMERPKEASRQRFETKQQQIGERIGNIVSVTTDYDMSGFMDSLANLWNSYQTADTLEKVEALLGKQEALERGVNLFYERVKQRGLIKQ